MRQRFNRLTLLAKDYVEIALNGTYELIKIAKDSSGILAPLSSALGGVLGCVELYKVSSVASLTSTLPYFIHRERLETIKRWIESLSLRSFTPPCVLIPISSDEGSGKDREEQGDDSEDNYKSTAAVRACHLSNMQLGEPKRLKQVVG